MLLVPGFLLSLLSLLSLLWLYFKIKTYHVNRNQYNVLPVKPLSHIKNNEYRDANNILWIKRGFYNSLLHNPFKYYVFETYDTQKKSSSEVKILKTDFDTLNIDRFPFQSSSFNYYSSFRYPVQHFFADVLPIIFF